MHLVAGHQLGAGTGKNDAAGFQDIGPVGDLQGGLSVLFDQEDGGAGGS